MKFSELKLNANVLDALDAMRFDECTPIQEQAIPIILEGKDLIAVAQTGTFLPWQIGHMGTIHGLYSDFDVVSIILSNSATLLAVLLLAMTLFRKDKRHLGDLLAHTQVQLKKE